MPAGVTQSWTANEIVLVRNWLDELKRLAPTN